MNACKATKQSIAVRHMRYEDVPAVFDLERTVFPLPWTKNSFFGELTTACSNSFVAVVPTNHNHAVIGYLCAWTVQDECALHKIAVSTPFRRTGTGRTLMNALMAEAYNRGARSVYLEVRATNLVAQRFYRSLGFEQTGIRQHYYSETGEDALVMSRRIDEKKPSTVRIRCDGIIEML